MRHFFLEHCNDRECERGEGNQYHHALAQGYSESRRHRYGNAEARSWGWAHTPHRCNQAFNALFPGSRYKKSATAVILCPGGGYSHLVTTKMEPIAKWLNQHGVSAFVLIYRAPKKRKDAFQDIQRAVRIVRSRASEWNVDPRRIGVMGSSAGGHLAARVSTGFDIQTYQAVDKHDGVSCKPDFTVLLYPAYMNTGTELSKEFTVSSEISPTLIVSAKDDKGFFPGSPIYANALKEAGASVRVHFFEKGGHGFSLRPKQYPLSTWPDLCLQWFRDIDILEEAAKKENAADKN